MDYKFNRELSFNSAKIGGSTTAFNRGQRFSPAFLTSRHTSNTTPSVQSQGDYYSSFGEAHQILCGLGIGILLVSSGDIKLRINKGAVMNEYHTVQFSLQEKVINLSFVIQNPEEDEPDVLILASVQGEGYIFRSRNVNSVTQWLSQQFQYAQVMLNDDDMAVAALN